MKATLTFKLPEDRDEHRLALHGADFYCVLFGFDSYLRACQRYGHGFKDVDDAVEKIREKLHEEMEDRNLSFDMVE